VAVLSRAPRSVSADRESGRVNLDFDFGADRMSAQAAARAIASWFKRSGVRGMLFIHSSQAFGDDRELALPDPEKPLVLEARSRQKRASGTKLRALPGGKKVR